MRSKKFCKKPVKSRDRENVEIVDNVDNSVEKYKKNNRESIKMGEI